LSPIPFLPFLPYFSIRVKYSILPVGFASVVIYVPGLSHPPPTLQHSLNRHHLQLKLL
jgi:hypothetical protein